MNNKQIQAVRKTIILIYIYLILFDAAMRNFKKKKEEQPSEFLLKFRSRLELQSKGGISQNIKNVSRLYVDKNDGFNIIERDLEKAVNEVIISQDYTDTGKMKRIDDGIKNYGAMRTLELRKSVNQDTTPLGEGAKNQHYLKRFTPETFINKADDNYDYELAKFQNNIDYMEINMENLDNIKWVAFKTGTYENYFGKMDKKFDGLEPSKIPNKWSSKYYYSRSLPGLSRELAVLQERQEKEESEKEAQQRLKKKNSIAGDGGLISNQFDSLDSFFIEYSNEKPNPVHRVLNLTKEKNSILSKYHPPATNGVLSEDCRVGRTLLDELEKKSFKNINTEYENNKYYLSQNFDKKL